ncbi:cobalamin-binding protein [Kaarinaea lacus]
MLSNASRFIIAIVSGAIVFAADSVPGNAEEIRVRDDTGKNVVLQQPAQRIVSLAPNIAELLFAIGAGNKIVGVVEHSDYPPQVKSIQQVGNHTAIDLERISILQPDLIVAWQTGNPDSALNSLQQMDYVIFRSEPKSLIDIPATMLRLSELAGTRKQATIAVADYQNQLEKLRVRYSGRKSVTVFYEIWNQPMMTVNGQHIINEVIEFCGGKNVFVAMNSLAPTVAVEPVLAANPQVIIASSSNGQAPEWLDDWRQWITLDAVRYDNLFHVDADTINRHTPRILKGVEQVCEALDIARQHIYQRQR